MITVPAVVSWSSPKQAVNQLWLAVCRISSKSGVVCFFLVESRRQPSVQSPQSGYVTCHILVDTDAISVCTLSVLTHWP